MAVIRDKAFITDNSKLSPKVFKMLKEKLPPRFNHVSQLTQGYFSLVSYTSKRHTLSFHKVTSEEYEDNYFVPWVKKVDEETFKKELFKAELV